MTRIRPLAVLALVAVCVTVVRRPMGCTCAAQDNWCRQHYHRQRMPEPPAPARIRAQGAKSVDNAVDGLSQDRPETIHSLIPSTERENRVG